MKKTIWMSIACFFVLALACLAAQKIPSTDEKAKESYTLGYEFGKNLKRDNVAVDKSVLFEAIADGLEGKQPALSVDEMRDTMEELRRKAISFREMRQRESIAKNFEEGNKFLEDYKTKDGVVTLESGVQYKILAEGKGPVPKETDSVTIHYKGTLVDGTEFDNSYKRGEPETLPVNSVIKGWTEALTRMNVGAKWQVVVPPDLAYGKRQYGSIPPNSTLIFELELLSIGNEKTSKDKADEKPPSDFML